MIKDKRIVFAAVTALVILFLAGFGYYFQSSLVSMKGDGESGIVYSLQPGKTLSLDSNWQAYTDRELSNEIDLQPVAFKTGSYFWHMKLKTAGMEGDNAFLLNPVYSAHKLWVNGDLVSDSGSSGKDGTKFPVPTSKVVPYTQEGSELDIVINISNYTHPFGGSLTNWLGYGRYGDIEYRAQQGRAVDFLIIFGLCSLALLHLFNYFYQKKYLYSRYFFIYLFIYAAYAVFSGRITGAYVLPVGSVAMVSRIQVFLLIAAFPIIFNYIRSLFPNEVSGGLARWLNRLVLPLSVLVFVLPLIVVREIFFYFTFLRMAGGLFLVIRMAAAVRAGRYASKSTLLTYSVMVICMLNDLLYVGGFISTVKLTWIGIFIFAAQQTYRLVVDSLYDYKMSEETHRKLTALTEQKDSFFSRNSVELARPIRNVVELGESLLKGSIGPLNSEQITTSSLIVSNGIRLSNMINDIIDFSSIKENKIQLSIGPVDFFKLTRKVLNSCEALVAIQDTTLKTEVERDTRLLAADEQRLEQAVYSIVSNSIRHTKSGGISIAAEEAGAELLISIRAKGCSLDSEFVTRLFEAYEQSQSEGLEEKDVFDLSLAIANKLIKLHGVDIDVESEGDILKYSFSMPFWAGEYFETEEDTLELDAVINLQPVLDEVTSDRNIEVMVAGKDVEELQIFKSQLASMNYSVIPIASGREVLERITGSSVQLVIIDVNLPDMSGYEVCSEIRKSYSKEALPVILVISKEDVTEMMEGFTSGANDFLTRPYLQEEFLTRVNTHLQLSRISTVYSRFVPKEFLSSLGQENIVDVKLGDQVQREMTILFVDIRAFTNLSENMTPEENFKFINSYLSRFSPMITDNGGFVDKYIGDAIMALFPNNPENALKAAKEMIEHVNVYNGHRANCGYRPINIGIGIHTGSMILGIIGDEERMQGTVISDAVNLAARIQDVTKLYKTSVVISQETFINLDNPMDYNFRFLGRVKVKGKDKAVALFEIYDSESEERRESKNRTKSDFEEAIMRFSRREFIKAENLLQNVIDSDPDDQTAAIFIERIKQMRIDEKKNYLTSL